MVKLSATAHRAIKAIVPAVPVISKRFQRNRRGSKRQRGERKCWHPISWEEHQSRLSDYEFRRRYRMSRETFAKFCEVVRPYVRTRDMGQFRRCTGHGEGKVNVEPPSLEVELAFTIRWLAGGQTADLMLVYRVPRVTLYDCCWKVIDAINMAMKVEFPTDISELRKLEAGFRRSDYPFWKGQVGAIDGVLFQTRNPGVEVPNPKQYYVERKGMYALLCIAVCDAQCRITWFDISHEPTSHDSLAFGNTDFGHRVTNGLLPENFFLNGDAAFTHGRSMVVPLGEAAFDWLQSSCRVVIERTFGLLIRRWGILWRPLSVMHKRRVDIIGACIRLHNFLITERLGQDPTPEVPLEFPMCAAHAEVVPGTWEVPPYLDADGRPNMHLDTEGQHEARRQAMGGHSAGSGLPVRARELADAAREWGLHERPYAKGHAPKRQKKTKRKLTY